MIARGGGTKLHGGGNSGNGNYGVSVWWSTLLWWQCYAGGGGGSLNAGSGINGGARYYFNYRYAMLSMDLEVQVWALVTIFWSSSGGAGGSSRKYALANTGSGGSDATSVSF